MPDSHLFQEAPAHVWDLASPAEIRRRGEARARRRRAGASLGGLVLGALIAAPLVLGVGGTRSGDVVAGDGSGRPSPPETSGGPWVHSIPASFTLDSGMGTADTPAVLSDREQDVRRVTICGTAALAVPSVAGTSDVLIATGSNAAGSPERRVLLVYPDRAGARGALRAVRHSAESCLAAGDGDERAIALGIGAEPAEWSWAYLFPNSHGLGPTEGTGSLLVGRVGNSVLVIQWAGGPSAEASADDRMPRHVLRLLQDMCVFDQGSC